MARCGSVYACFHRVDEASEWFAEVVEVFTEEFKVFKGDTSWDIVDKAEEVCDAASPVIAGVAVVKLVGGAGTKKFVEWFEEACHDEGY